MDVTKQTLKGDDYNVFMKIPTCMMDEMYLENGDWVKLRVGQGYFALVKTDDRRGMQLRGNQIRFPQRFSHTYRVRANDTVQLQINEKKITFKKLK
ncbi:hypothetical protein [Brevibacillus sp. NRS-1366]|uniref:hypothetical protein n=1 Tax=Brevibacillus sp. NRS-1366 TaxID=3233899 RepID=UPI003D261844